MVDIDGCQCCCEAFDMTVTILIFLLNLFQNGPNKNLWIYRMLIGLVISIVDFIVICAVNNGDYLDDEVKKGLFGSIICYV